MIKSAWVGVGWRGSWEEGLCGSSLENKHEFAKWMGEGEKHSGRKEKIQAPGRDVVSGTER